MRCRIEGDMTIGDGPTGRSPGRAHDEAPRAAITEDDIVQSSSARTLNGMRHPRPLQVNMKQPAEMLNVSSMTVSRMVRAGTIKLSRTGMIRIEEVDRALRDRAENCLAAEAPQADLRNVAFARFMAADIRVSCLAKPTLLRTGEIQPGNERAKSGRGE